MNAKVPSLLQDSPRAAVRPGSTSPPRGRPTRERSEQLNRQLLERALDLFLERGFGGTTIEAIVESVGTARRTVYSRYSDKLTLFKAALQLAIDGLVVPAEQLFREEKDDLEETLLNVATLVLARMRSPAGLRLMRIANSEVYSVPELAPYIFERTSKVTIDYLTDLFERRLPSEGSADLAVAFYALAIDGSYRAARWYPASEDEFMRQVTYRVRLVLRGAGSSYAAAPP